MLLSIMVCSSWIKWSRDGLFDRGSNGRSISGSSNGSIQREIDIRIPLMNLTI